MLRPFAPSRFCSRTLQGRDDSVHVGDRRMAKRLRRTHPHAPHGFGDIKDGMAKRSRNVGVGAFIEQNFHTIGTPLLRGDIQRGIARWLFQFQFRPPVCQELHNNGVTVESGLHQWRPIVRATTIYVGALLDKPVHLIGVVYNRRLQQTRVHIVLMPARIKGHESYSENRQYTKNREQTLHLN